MLVTGTVKCLLWCIVRKMEAPKKDANVYRNGKRISVKGRRKYIP